MQLARLPFSFAPSDEAGEVPTLTVLHDDKDGGVGSVDDAIVVANNILMFQLP